MHNRRIWTFSFKKHTPKLQIKLNGPTFHIYDEPFLRLVKYIHVGLVQNISSIAIWPLCWSAADLADSIDSDYAEWRTGELLSQLLSTAGGAFDNRR